MHHPRGVNHAQALCQPSGQRQHRIDGQRPVLAHRLSQRQARHIVRSQPRRLGIDVRVHHQRRERTADQPRGRHRRPEPNPEPRVRGQFGADNLHRHRPARRRKTQVNPPHAAFAQPPEQPVRPNDPWVSRLKFLHHANPHPNVTDIAYGVVLIKVILLTRPAYATQAMMHFYSGTGLCDSPRSGGSGEWPGESHPRLSQNPA